MKSCPHAQSKLVSPSGRDVAQRQRGLAPSLRELDLPQAKTEGVLQIGKIRMRFALIRTGQHRALSVICFANASSPKGRAEKPVQAESLTNQSSSDADLFACCSFRHGLRRATFLREEGFCPYAQTNLSLPLGEMSRSDREGRLPCEGAGLPPCGKTEGVLQIGKIRMRFDLIRTCQRPALSVICFANASSPKGRAEKSVRTDGFYRLVFTQRAVLPHGRA